VRPRPSSAFCWGRAMADLLPAGDAQSIQRAVEVMLAGGVTAFPTDTVYGLGAHSGLDSAIETLYALKGRERQKAIALLLASVEEVQGVAVEVPDVAWGLAERFWPGPMTLVVRKAPGVSEVLAGGSDTVAVRVPAHAVTLQLISALGAPLAATSANLSGQSEAITAEEVRRVFGDRIKLILDGGPCPGGVASTVVDVTVHPALIRRRGPVGAEIEAYLSRSAQKGAR
jgi:L-threonylcarbamoyladenylate synthase